MHINPTQEKKWHQLQQRISNIWLFWGLFPADPGPGWASSQRQYRWRHPARAPCYQTPC